MMELITRTARLVPYAKRPKQVPSFVTAFVYEPAAEDATAPLGSLFVIVEVLLSGRPGEDIANLITGTVERTYYGDEDAETDPLARFEAATKAVNAALSDHVNQGNAAWIGKLSAILAVQAGDELHLSHTGSADAYLYRHQSATRITTSLTERPTGPAKTFGSIASGQLETGDHLLLATPALIHQVSLKKLHDIVGATSPNAAIAELSDILKGTDSTRIAALVVELTTPELAALQVRSDHPSDITIGAPESPIEAAKLMATPIAAATVATSKRAHSAAKVGWTQAKPQLNRVGLKAAGVMRAALTGERVAKRSALGVLIVVTIIGLFLWHQAGNKANAKLVSRFRTDAANYLSASTIPDVATRHNELTITLGDVNAFSASNTKQLVGLLKHTSLPAGSPTSVAALKTAISGALSSLDGLISVSGTTVASSSSFKGSTPSLMELNDKSLYVVDATSASIYVVNITTNSVTKSSAATSKLGHVVATANSSAGDGMYLLTSAPSVWFYNYTKDSVSQLSLGLSDWESGTSIASYAGNLYILSNGQVEKHVRTSTGFAAATSYFTGTSTVPDAAMLTVDGYVYVSGSDGLYQYLTGAAQTSVPARFGLTSLSSLRSDAAGNIIGVDKSTGRIGVWSDAKSLTYVKQFAITGAKTVSDAVYDSASGKYFAIANGQVVSFTGSN